MGRKGTGVEPRDSSIRIKFVYKGETFRERLTVNGKALEPTPANLKFATRLALEVRRKIDLDAFDFTEFFPESKHALKRTEPTFGPIAAEWLLSKGQLEKATLDQYTNAVAMWKRMLGADTPMSDLTHKRLSSAIGGHPWASAKSANNYLIVLRGIFAFEFHGPRAGLNPMIGIGNLKVVKKLPDPLTPDERDRILADLAKWYDPRVVAYFTFAFLTGLRPEEMIALRWEDVDFGHKTVRIQRVRTFRGSERDGSKTHSERDVDLVSGAMAALQMMKPYTFMKRDDDGEPVDIFENPVTGRRWHDERSQRDHYWAPTLKRLGIRHRRAYNTRHTYATAALMAGVNPAYIARQLGHTNTKMLFETYSRWIDGADKGAERRALEAAMGGAQSAKVPNSSR